VAGATAAYRKEQDTLGNFLEDRCFVGEMYADSAKNIYNEYRQWAVENGFSPWSKKRLGQKLTERGFVEERTMSERKRAGLAMRHEW
jgi:phage/plasmid-associated DNA primase